MSFRAFRSVARAAMLAAGGLASADAFALGRVVLLNELPIDAQCVFNVSYVRTDPAAWGVELTQGPIVLPPGSAVQMNLPLASMPPQLRQSPGGVIHMYSAAFGHIDLVCSTHRDPASGVWRHAYTARFDNGREEDARDDSSSDASDWRAGWGLYTLNRQTPNDVTVWSMRLRPRLAQATAAQMRAGAGIDVHVSTQLVPSSLVELQGEMLPVGVYRMPLVAGNGFASFDSTSPLHPSHASGSSHDDSDSDMNGGFGLNGQGDDPEAAT